jgi:hypothetical protein
MSWLLTSVAVPLALAACGGGSGGGSPAPAPPATYSVTANVSGLSGSGLVLALGNGAKINVSGNGPVTLVSGLSNAAAYEVTVKTQPPAPVQICAVNNGSGTIASANASVTVSCVAGTVTTVNTTVTYDSSIPASAQSRVTQLVSASATVSPGGTLAIPITLTGADALIMALDVNNNVVAADMADSSSATLTATSTAIALTRLILGPPSGSLTVAQLNQAIQSTAEFPNLVSSIQSAYSAGITLANSAAIFTSLDIVATQLPSSLLAQLSSAPRKQAQSLASPVIPPSPLPYTLETWSSGSYQSIFVTGADSSKNGVDLLNSMSIDWWAASADINGVDLSAGGVSLPAASLATQAALLLPNQTVQTVVTYFNKVPLPGNGAAFNVDLLQNPNTHLSNVRLLSENVLDVVLPLTIDCVQQIVDAVIAEPPETWSGTVTYINTILPAAIGNLVLPSKCTVAAGKLAVGNLTAGAFKFLTAELVYSPVDVVYKGVQVGNILVEVSEMAQYWAVGTSGTPAIQVGVCEGKSGGGVQLSNGASTLQFTIGQPAQPAQLFMAPGAVNQNPPMVSAKDIMGNSTLVPSDVLYKSNFDTIAQVDPQSDQVTALMVVPALQQVTITGTSASTGASGSYPVFVLIPVVTPATAAAQAGGGLTSGTVKLQLTDTTGDVVLAPPNAYWRTSDTQGLSLVPFPPPSSLAGNLFLGSNVTVWVAPQNAIPVPVTISAYDPNDNLYGSAVITVSGLYPTTTTVVANPPSLHSTGGSVTLTATIATQSTVPSGTPAPIGSVTFTDTTGATFCAQPVTVTAGVATCTVSITTPPDTVTANYSGDPNYAASTGSATVTVAAQGPNTCVPTQGATTCTVSTYILGSGTFTAPVTVTVTGNNNGAPINNTSLLRVNVYQNVPGSCDPTTPGCPSLTGHPIQACAVNGVWVPVGYNSTVSLVSPLPSNCTGSAGNLNVITSYSVDGSGNFVISNEIHNTANHTCTDAYGQVTSSSDTSDNKQSASVSLSDGSGNGNVNYIENASSTGNPPYVESYAGQVSWPAETPQPPIFTGEGVSVSRTTVAAGATLPMACVAPGIP